MKKIFEKKKKLANDVMAKSQKTYQIIRRRHRLKFYLERAGIYANEKIINRIIFNIAVAINLVISAYILYFFVTKQGFPTRHILFVMLFLWLLVFPVILFILWAIFYGFLDLRAYKRRLEIEEVLPDFLQLTASNIRAGMLIDRALWYAVRPRFGILAKEIEIAAKETMTGIDIKSALIKFGDRYDSVILKRTVSLILEGMSAGGNMGDLVNKIAVDIQESKVIQREMAANVSNYIIFIGFASVVAAPILFALGHQFIIIIQKISVGVSIPAGVGVGLMTISGRSISTTDFNIFAITSLISTSLFSSLIIATIKKGDIRDGVRYIPVFIIATVLLFYLTDKALGSALGGFF